MFTSEKKAGFINGSPMPLRTTLAGDQGRESSTRRNRSSVRSSPPPISLAREHAVQCRLQRLEASIWSFVGHQPGRSRPTYRTFILNAARFHDSARINRESTKFERVLMLANLMGRSLVRVSHS